MKFKVITAFLAVALIAGAAVMSLSSKPGVASAAPGDVTVTFTWWATDAVGTLAGSLGTGVGTGTMSATLTAYVAGPPTTSTVIFDMKGSLHATTMTLNSVDAATSGTVTAGWLQGQKVAGTIIVDAACGKGTGTCYTATVVVNDPSAAGGTAATPPAAGGTGVAVPKTGTGVANTDESPMANLTFLGGLALSLASAAGLGAMAVRRARRS